MALFKVQVKEDIFRLLFFRDCVSEFLGSFFMVLFVAFLMVSLNTELYKPNTFQAGVTMGLNIFILIEAFGPISCHINPTVSFAWCLSGRITVFRGKAPRRYSMQYSTFNNPIASLNKEMPRQCIFLNEYKHDKRLQLCIPMPYKV